MKREAEVVGTSFSEVSSQGQPLHRVSQPEPPHLPGKHGAAGQDPAGTSEAAHGARHKLRLCQNFLQKLRFLADEVCPVPERYQTGARRRGCIEGVGPPALTGVEGQG